MTICQEPARAKVKCPRCSHTFDHAMYKEVGFIDYSEGTWSECEGVHNFYIICPSCDEEFLSEELEEEED